MTHWKRSWCWKRLKEGGEGNIRGWHGWMASLTWWTWVWGSSGSWWWTGKPGMLHSMGLQRVRHDWATNTHTHTHTHTHTYHSNSGKWRGTNEPLHEGQRRDWKASLKLSIQKAKITASSPTTSWQVEGEKEEAMTDFIFLGSKITADCDCHHEIKRHLFAPW